MNLHWIKNRVVSCCCIHNCCGFAIWSQNYNFILTYANNWALLVQNYQKLLKNNSFPVHCGLFLTNPINGKSNMSKTVFPPFLSSFSIHTKKRFCIPVSLMLCACTYAHIYAYTYTQNATDTHSGVCHLRTSSVAVWTGYKNVAKVSGVPNGPL